MSARLSKHMQRHALLCCGLQAVLHWMATTVLSLQGVLGSGQQARQVFERISPADLATDADARFNHFRKALWPTLRERTGGSS